MGKRVAYKTADGVRVPGVTTITSRFQDSGGLLYWANQQGLEGKTLNEAREKVATPGSMAHELVEHHVNGWDAPDLSKYSDEQVELAERAFENFLKWQEQSRLTFRHTEFNLVSELHRYGGRADAIAVEPDGKLVICDFKTGGLYANHLWQVAAYQHLWNENYPGDAPDYRSASDQLPTRKR